MDKYVILYATLNKKIVGGSLKGVPELEKVINAQASKGYRLHTFDMVSVAESPATVQVIMVFEKI